MTTNWKRLDDLKNKAEIEQIRESGKEVFCFLPNSSHKNQWLKWNGRVWENAIFGMSSSYVDQEITHYQLIEPPEDE